MYTLARQLLFKLSPETSHELSIDLIGAGGRLGLNRLLTPEPASLPVSVLGLEFPNPVGLAAGLDKNGDAIDGFGQLGFGFIEIGTVTPRPQPGNPKPRLFRLPQANAIINRMGFNNHGVDHLLAVSRRVRDDPSGADGSLAPRHRQQDQESRNLGRKCGCSVRLNRDPSQWGRFQ